MKTRREKKRVIRLLILCMLCSIFFSHIRERDYVQDRLIAEIDRQCSGEGECMLDLAEAFSDFAWDAVSVYMAGNSRQIREALGVYTEAEDGIVFSKDGIPILEHQSASASLANCGHLRPCKKPCLQARFLGLRAFSTPWQSVDFVNILKGRFPRPFLTS